MNAIIIFKDFREIEINEKIDRLLSKILVNDTNNRNIHKIGMILLLYLLDYYKLDIFLIGKTFKYVKENIPTCSVNISLSYCNSGVAAAISDGNIGIDIEDMSNYNLDIFGEFEDKSNPIKTLTLKEAFGKYLKTGLNYNYKNIDLSVGDLNFYKYGCYFRSFIYDGFIVSCCSDIQDVKLINIETDAFIKFIDKLEKANY